MKLTKYTTIPFLAAILAGVAVEATPHQQVDIVQASTTKNQGASKSEKPGKPGGKKTGTPPSGNPPQKPNGQTGKGGPNTQSYDYSGTLKATVNVKTGSKTVGKKTISNSQSDQNTALVQKNGKLTLDGTTLKKTGASANDDNANFYGIDSVILANGKNAVATVNKAKILSNATGANGIFATNSGTVNVKNSTITTTGKANSRGLDATYGGKINADQIKISTQGDHSAGVATDRGGGVIKVKNFKITTSGSGSPLVYSTGNISLKNVKGTASGSQIAGMEGYNKIFLNNSKLTSTSNKISGSDPIKNGVIIYQSTSGDADTSSGKSATFKAKDSTLKTKISSGAMFYVTNTTGKITLENTKLDFNSQKVNLLNVTGNKSNNWGTKGKNGGHITLTATKQKLSGNITVDSISSANVKLLKNSVYTGKTSIVANSYASSKAKTPLTMNISNSSKWVVTGNSTVTNLSVAKGGKVVDAKGRKVTIVENGKTVQKGSSPYKITVKGAFSEKN